MKKLVFLFFVVLLVALMSSQTALAQRRESCVTYDASRTLEGFKSVILTWKDPFIKAELWPAYAERANQLLQTSKIERIRGLVVTPDLKGMTWLMSHTVEYEFSYFKQSDFWNGTRLNNKLEYRDVAGNESSWAVFEYEDVSGLYSKVKCCNPQKPKVPEVAYQTPPAPEPTPAPKVDPEPEIVIQKKIIVQQEVVDPTYMGYQTPYYGGYYGREFHNDYYNGYSGYCEPSFGFGLGLSFGFGRSYGYDYGCNQGYMGGNTYIDNSSYNYSNVVDSYNHTSNYTTTTNNRYNYDYDYNYTNNHYDRTTNNNHASGPGGRGDQNTNHATGPGGRNSDSNNAGGNGGRGDENTNHASGPSGTGNGGNNAGGAGGRSAMTYNQNQIMSRGSSSVSNSGTSSRVNSSANYSTNGRINGRSNGLVQTTAEFNSRTKSATINNYNSGRTTSNGNYSGVRQSRGLSGNNYSPTGMTRGGNYGQQSGGRSYSPQMNQTPRVQNSRSYNPGAGSSYSGSRNMSRGFSGNAGMMQSRSYGGGMSRGGASFGGGRR